MTPVTVSIPDGAICRSGAKPCIFARYTRKWDAYNCMIHHKILKGGQTPRKCAECLEYCKKKGAQARVQDHDRLG